MSYYRRCDVCCKRSVDWYFRKRWRVFRWESTMYASWKENMDFCDECIDHFKVWVRRQIRQRGDK